MRKRLFLLTLAAFALNGCSKAPDDEGVVDTTLAGDGDEMQAATSVALGTERGDINKEVGGSAKSERRASGADMDEDWSSENDDPEAEIIKTFEPRGPIPRGNPGAWITSNDYPSRALREERSGTASFRVAVDQSGKVSDCQIVDSSGSADLDEATCTNIRRRARFIPATSSDGQPTVGSYSNSIRWTIPEG